MKLFVLTVVSLILSVNSEDVKPAQSVLEALYPVYQDSYYYGRQGYLDKEENRDYKPRNNKPSQNYGNNREYTRDDKYNNKNVKLEPDYIGYYAREPEKRRFYDNKYNYQYRLIGRVGLGFDKRTATTYSYLAPLTSERLDLVGTRPYAVNNKGYNYLNLNLNHSSNIGEYNT